MSKNPQRISSLSPERQKLLQRLLGGTAPESAQTASITHHHPDGPAPLSIAQERLWFLEQVAPGSIFNNVPLIIHLTGALDVATLAGSVKLLVQRHAALRTTFVASNGQPRQIVLPNLSILLPVVDLSDLVRESEKEVQLQRLVQDEAALPFDLQRGPLLRTTLVRLGATRQVLLLTMHHLICDGQSLAICRQELVALYEALSTGQTIQLPELPIEYVDFALWQRERLQGSYLEELVRYWHAQLSDVSPVLDKLADGPKGISFIGPGAIEKLVLPRELVAQLQTLSQHEKVTLFMTLVAGFKALLYRYTRHQFIAVGSAIAWRTRKEIENLIGFFVNMLVLQTDLSGNPTFRQLLARESKVALGAYAHQDLPFDRLVKELSPSRELNTMPLLEIVFTQGLRHVQLSTASNLLFEFQEGDSGQAQFDLEICLVETEAGRECLFKYRVDRFASSTIQRMQHHYLKLLQEAATNPDRPLSDLPLLREQEYDQILVEWNRTRTDYPATQAVNQLFEAQVERTPESIAAVFEDEQFTYSALNQLANRLAHTLRGWNVGPEIRVGLCVERKASWVVGALGILKSGGAYVPLDPDYPSERLAFMLVHSQIHVLVTQKHVRAQLSVPANIRVIELDTDRSMLAGNSLQNPVNQTLPDHLAYVMYTSGSTGEPKGIGIPHRAITRLVCCTNYIDIECAERIAQASNVSFDAATFEVWGALLHGACLVGVSKETLLSPKDMAARLRRDGIDILFLTTALFNQVVREVPTAFQSLRYLLFGGEAVDPQWVRMAIREGSPRHFLHVYGPTETTTFASWYPIQQVAEQAVTVPIGHPLANTTLYVLDEYLMPVPVGIPGELYIGGDGLARGYLHRPELTAERFIPDPYSQMPGGRLYRTGDQVRYLLDGSIEYLGRLDAQVKIRGFRIEPGEIEAVLQQHSSVREVVVMVREELPGDKYLVAYIVPEQEGLFDSKVVREYLRRKLPEYMVPTFMVPLPVLPLNSNGKVDRFALPAPASEHAERSADFVVPRTDTEKALVRIWSAVLNVERVGINDSFFLLGGHSLLATSIIAKVQTDLQVELSLRSLFDAPTIAEFALQVEAARGRATKLSNRPIVPVPRDGIR